MKNNLMLFIVAQFPVQSIYFAVYMTGMPGSKKEKGLLLLRLQTKASLRSFSRSGIFKPASRFISDG